MKLVLREGLLFKGCTDAIKDLVRQGNMECSEGGLVLNTLDPSHVAMVRLELQKDLFDEFSCDESFTMGLNMDSLHKIMKCMDRGDVLGMSTKRDSDILNFEFTGGSSMSSKEFSLRLMNIDEVGVDIPDYDYDVGVSLSCNAFAKAIRDLGSLGEHITIELSGQGARFHVEGDIGSGCLFFEKTTDDLPGAVRILEDEGEKVHAKFSGKYLLQFTRASGVGTEVHLYMAGDLLLVRFPLSGGGSVLDFFLAPQTDDDDEPQDETQGGDAGSQGPDPDVTMD